MFSIGIPWNVIRIFLTRKIIPLRKDFFDIPAQNGWPVRGYQLYNFDRVPFRTGFTFTLVKCTIYLFYPAV